MQNGNEISTEASTHNIEVGVGPGGFQYKGSSHLFLKGLKWFLIIVFVFVLSVIGIFYYKGHLGPFFDPKQAYIESKKNKLRKAYPNIQKVIISYDEYLGYSIKSLSNDSLIETDGLKFLKNNIDSAIELFSSTVPQDFEKDFSLWVWHHQALMYLIHGDIKKDHRSLIMALHSINEAEKIIKEGLTEGFLQDNKGDHRLKEINTKVQYDKFIILIFNFIEMRKSEDLNQALTIVEAFGGCDYLLKQNVLHRDIYRTVGCNNNMHPN